MQVRNRKYFLGISFVRKKVRAKGARTRSGWGHSRAAETDSTPGHAPGLSSTCVADQFATRDSRERHTCNVATPDTGRIGLEGVFGQSLSLRSHLVLHSTWLVKPILHYHSQKFVLENNDI